MTLTQRTPPNSHTTPLLPSAKRPLQQLALQLGKSALTGGLATAASMLSLFLLVQWAAWSPREANVPSLLLGGWVQFLGNRHFVFLSGHQALHRQFWAFCAAEAVSFVLNAWLFDWSVTRTHLHYEWVRCLTTFLVFSCVSYPLWAVIFKDQKDPSALASPPAPAAPRTSPSPPTNPLSGQQQQQPSTTTANHLHDLVGSLRK